VLRPSFILAIPTASLPTVETSPIFAVTAAMVYSPSALAGLDPRRAAVLNVTSASDPFGH